MKRLLIVGAGDFGREVLEWALHIPANTREWEIGGFLDSNPASLQRYSCSYPILGDPALYEPDNHDCFICAIGDPRTKLHLCDSLINRGGEFISLIHPSAVVGSRNSIGVGCVFCPGAIVTTDVTLGRFVTLNLHATVGHNAVLGDGCTLSPHCDVTGHAVLGKGVFLGSHASILPSVQIGDYAVVGAGSVVLRKVNPETTVIGVPARQVSGF